MNRSRTCGLALLALLLPASTPADTLTIAEPTPGSLAFARYIAWLQQRDPFTESGPISVVIEASLPASRKESRLLAIRETTELERREYRVLGSDGDAEVTQQVIAPYLAEQKQIEALPVPSVIITPANYKFRYMGEASLGDSRAHIFRIVPRKKREGLIRGELWIDSETGAAVVQAGYLVKTASAGIRRLEMVRDTKLQNGSPYSRITRVALETPAGRGYLTMTEFRSAAASAAVRDAQPGPGGAPSESGPFRIATLANQ